ncbi:hypothetical protein VTN00DRAFT_1850 [Thermoascus crustaceus]|uniref:uncharacterized protein n=1 Tax=Thermoascus crustaceus TaxID=5088 RepID=UPI003742EB6C
MCSTADPDIAAEHGPDQSLGARTSSSLTLKLFGTGSRRRNIYRNGSLCIDPPKIPIDLLPTYLCTYKEINFT